MIKVWGCRMVGYLFIYGGVFPYVQDDICSITFGVGLVLMVIGMAFLEFAGRLNERRRKDKGA